MKDIEKLKNELLNKSKYFQRVLEKRIYNLLVVIKNLNNNNFICVVFNKSLVKLVPEANLSYKLFKQFREFVNDHSSFFKLMINEIYLDSFYIYKYFPIVQNSNIINLSNIMDMKKLNFDKCWFIFCSLIKIVGVLKNQDITLKFLPIDRIWIINNNIFIDPYEYMNFKEENLIVKLNLQWDKVISNSNHSNMIIPEIFLNLKITDKSYIWILGNLLYMLLEVKLIEKKSFCTKFV